MNVGVIFGMIIAIIVIASAIIFGYQQLVYVSEVQGIAAINKAINSFEIEVDRIYGMGGETSSEFAFKFPNDISKVCFLPVYRGERTSEAKIRRHLEEVMQATGREGDRIAALFAKLRYVDGIDNNESLLIFFEDTDVPEFKFVEHLEPSEKNNEVVCVSGNGRVVLTRRFDLSGAWVDIDKA